MSDDQDIALKKCVLKEFTSRTKDAILSTATTFEDNLFQTWITGTAKHVPEYSYFFYTTLTNTASRSRCFSCVQQLTPNVVIFLQVMTESAVVQRFPFLVECIIMPSLLLSVTQWRIKQNVKRRSLTSLFLLVIRVWITSGEFVVIVSTNYLTAGGLLWAISPVSSTSSAINHYHSTKNNDQQRAIQSPVII